MAIDFRCENCGKLLSVEAEPASKIKCPYCKAKVLVPAGLASLPRPQVPGGADQAEASPAPPPPPVEEELLVTERQDALMGVMATLMPWVISLFFHAGVLVILAFITIVMLKDSVRADVTVPEIPLSENLGGRIDPGEISPDLHAKSMQPDRHWAKRDSKIPMANLGKTESKIALYGSMGGSSGGAAAPLGLLSGGTGAGPRSRFCGTGGSAYHIVYVVDRSGSMLDTFDEVRKEMIRSFSRLSPQQTFHVIFFASGKPKENPPRRLVYATETNKREALKFLKVITPEGQTDPIPALKRAFAVLNRTPGSKRGKLLYLLTDGEFPDNEKVYQAIKNMNAAGKVHINTILHHHHSPDVMKVLGRIAKENGGRFKFVEPNE